MKKNRIIKASVYLFAAALLSSAAVVPTKAMEKEKQVKTNTVVTQGHKEDEAATAAVDALFTDKTWSDIKDDVTRDDIDAAAALVAQLDNQRLKEQLEYLINVAYYKLHERETIALVYALFSDSEHTVIREDLTQAEIDQARDMVEQLGSGILKYDLTILVNSAQEQLDERNPQLAV